MKKTLITRRNGENWNTNSGELIEQGMFYVVIDEKPNKLKLAGLEHHWALSDRFDVINSSYQGDFVTLVDKREDIYFLNVSLGEQRNDIEITRLKDHWDLSEKAIDSLYKCIRYIKEKGEQSLIAWAVKH